MITVIIVYEIKKGGKRTVQTNATIEVVKEILHSWIINQFGEERDIREANHKEIYTIQIKVDQNDGIFLTESDTGNDRFTAAIVERMLILLPSIEIIAL